MGALYEFQLEARLMHITAALNRMAEHAVVINSTHGKARDLAVGALVCQVWEARAMLGLPEIEGLKPV